MNFKLALTFLFKDEFWFKKINLPAIYLLIPGLGQAVVSGWSLKITKNVIDGVAEPLPDSEFAEDLQRGISTAGILFVYMIPLYFLSSLITWVTRAAMQNAGMALSDMNYVTFALGIVYTILMFWIVLFSEIASVNYIAKGDLKAAFKLKEIWQLFRSNPGDWIISLLIVFLLGLLLAPLGILVCVVGLFFVVTHLMTVSGHLAGQAYLRSVKKLETSDTKAE